MLIELVRLTEVIGPMASVHLSETAKQVMRGRLRRARIDGGFGLQPREVLTSLGLPDVQMAVR